MKERILQTPNILEDLRKLVELQKLDKEIFSLKQTLSESPRTLEALSSEFEFKKATFKSLEENRQKLQLKQKEKEGDLAAREEGIKKAHGQLGVLKTNKEYQAKLAEIESLKADKSLIEEDILRLMDQVEEAKKSVDAEKIRLNEEEKIFNEKKETCEEQAKNMEAEIQTLTGKRSIGSSVIDKKVLNAYEHILQGRAGVALVLVKDNSCLGCHMRVPHQVINEIKMHDRLITCENCSRILYLDEDVEA